MSHFRTVLRNSSYLLGFKLLSRLLSVAFLIYAATKLGPELFGVLSFVLVTVELLTGVGDMGITRYGARELVRSWKEKEVLAGKILSLQLLTSLPLVAAGLILLLLFQSAYPKSQLLFLGLGAFLLYGLIGATESVFTASQKFFFSALFTFAGRIIYVGFGVIALSAGWSVVMVMWGFLAAVVIETIARLAFVMSRITSFSFHFPIGSLWRMLVVTIPFAVAGIASVLSYRVNVMILELFKGDAATGIYNIAFTLFTPFVWVNMILSTTAFPGFTQIYLRDRQAARFNGWQWYRLMTLAGIPAALFVSLLARPILDYFPAGYRDSASILIVLIWSLPPILLGTIDVNILQATDHQREAARGMVLGAILTALLSFVLIPFLGGIGAAWAAVGSSLGMEIYIHFQVRQNFMKRYVLPLLLRPVLGGVAMGAVALALFQVNVWLAAGTGLLVYGITVFASGAIRPSEIKALVRG